MLPSLFFTLPTGTHTNWLPMLSCITIPSSTLVPSITLKPFGILTLFPKSSTTTLFPPVTGVVMSDTCGISSFVVPVTVFSISFPALSVTFTPKVYVVEPASPLKVYVFPVPVT